MSLLKVGIPLLVLLALVWAYSERRGVFVAILTATSSGAPPPLLDAQDEGAASWADDYFTVEQLAPDTWAIGEPRYAQQNFNYLIAGSRRAVLFDAGPGIRNVRAVAESLTDRPIIFLPSHFHYDHVGNQITFDEIAMVDLAYLRNRAPGNRLTPSRAEHVGRVEGFQAPTWQVDHWWAPGETIDLGGRTLELLHTPGHTPESVSLWDRQNGLVFTGDYLYPGSLYAFVPGSRMGDYLAVAQTLLAELPEGTQLLGAHRVVPPGAPRLDLRDLRELRAVLEGIRAGDIRGERGYPSRFRVNEQLDILAEPRWMQDWD